MHEKRAIVIGKIYAHIAELENAFKYLTMPNEPAGIASQEDREKDALQAGRKLFGYYSKKRLFLRESLAKKIDTLIDTSHQILLNGDLKAVIQKNG